MRAHLTLKNDAEMQDRVSRILPSGVRVIRTLARMVRFGFLWRVTGTRRAAWHVTRRSAQADYDRRYSDGLTAFEREYADVGGV